MAHKTNEPRAWVVRCGQYLRIFGNPYKNGSWWFYTPEQAIEGYVAKAQRRELELRQAGEVST